ncbi:beta-1:4-N-acetylgalactosaminyltransferase bre-4-like protein [Leptotrombidium deliense]|uniref:Beta-1:4-N-acetylgalactosaminyltransferase bre-4-like protein n=1 Tax=Leptotrombidium deliense TaxID=299467 RepID=A0A443S824_9ACAR|nr:beta-1:4-N-acetylgalactosaminyltransferase bre-4-like protein [Leptotrombidium deliense]
MFSSRFRVYCSNITIFEKYLFAYIFVLFIHSLTIRNLSPVDVITNDQLQTDLLQCSPKRVDYTVFTSRCPVVAPNLDNDVTVATEVNEDFLSKLPVLYSIKPGGSHKPEDCWPNFNVAIIVAYRNRSTHLQLFLQHMHPFLNSQLLSYTIFIVEQSDEHLFNRGKLFNIGFKEASKLDSFCCFIFHDIDLLPENQMQIYACSSQPRHMSANVDKLRYVLLYPELFGGAVALSKEHFERVNGFANYFFGWGGEDDDMSRRVRDAGLEIVRFSSHASKYKMLPHNSQEGNPERLSLLFA